MVMETVTYRAPTTWDASHNGSRFPVENRRVAPTDANKFVQRSDYLEVEEYYDDPSVGYVRLYESSTAEVGGKGLVIRARDGSRTWAGTLNYPPQPSQYYYNPYMGFCFFNKTDLGQQIIVAYTAKGSIIAAEEINWLWNAASNAARPWLITDITLPAYVHYDLKEQIVLDVFEVFTVNPETGEKKCVRDPQNILVEIHDADSPNLYYSRITNLDPDGNVRVFRARAIPKLIPEK